MAARRPLTVNVLVVDDEQTDLDYYIPLLEGNASQALRNYWPHNEGDIELHFRGLTPRSDESIEEFFEAFRLIVSCEEPNWHDFAQDLQVVIFDLHFDRPHCVDAGQQLAAILRSTRPAVHRLLFSGLDLDQVVGEYRGLFEFPVSKAALSRPSGTLDFLRGLIHAFAERFDTPFWEALHEFVGMPKVVMHAMAGADGRMSEASVTQDRFLDFFGLAYLQVEGSSTAQPLDSLLNPHASIAAAQRSLAKAFGSDRAAFVTHGTSTSNKIVYATHVRPGDLVFVDRSCHISHHYGIALTRARVWYLDGFVTGVAGVPGGVSASVVADALRQVIQTTTSQGGKAILPKVIALTNCTFDGLICNPSKIFEAVVDVLIEFDLSNRLEEIVFLFDEAWFSFGYFHPRFHGRTAMGAAAALSYNEQSGRYWEGQLRVYVTQSLHKTTGAFRQASVILIRDPKLPSASPRLARSGLRSSPDLQLERRFNEAYLCHTTTSPSLPLLASIDIARRQMDVEGCRLVSLAIQGADRFRAAAAIRQAEGGRPHFGQFLTVVSESDFIPEEQSREFIFDPTKVTLQSTSGQSGATLRTALWNTKGIRIQVNKFSTDSILFMFMPGTTSDWLSKLVQALNDVTSEWANRDDDPAPRLAETPQIPFLQCEYINEQGRRLRYPDCLLEIVGPDLYGALFGNLSQFARRLEINNHVLAEIQSSALTLISADFITPYPPGYPILVPGQVIPADVLRFLLDTDHAEIHGVYRSRRTISINAIDFRDVSVANNQE